MKKDPEKTWERCLAVIRDNVNPQSFKTWFEPIKAMKLSDNVLTIQVPSQFFYEWLEEHYIGLLKNCLLYTSDAADERSRVSLCGRPSIKKKKQR